MISQIGWWGAIMIGFLHRHWRHEINTPGNPWVWIFGIIIILTAIYMIGELVLNHGKAMQKVHE